MFKWFRRKGSVDPMDDEFREALEVGESRCEFVGRDLGRELADFEAERAEALLERRKLDKIIVELDRLISVFKCAVASLVPAKVLAHTAKVPPMALVEDSSVAVEDGVVEDGGDPAIPTSVERVNAVGDELKRVAS